MTPLQKHDSRHLNFLLSNWYSGATVLSILLNNHESITCNGETFPFYDQDPSTLKCSCGKNLLECEFYRFAASHFRHNENYDKDYFVTQPRIYQNKYLQRIFDSFLRFHNIRNAMCHFTPGFSKKIDTFINLHSKFFERACEFDNSKIYLDGVKSIRRVELFAKYSRRPIRIIHNIRDGRKFAASYIRNHKVDNKFIPAVAQRWIDYIHMIDVLNKRYSNIQVKIIRHEDLCADKVSTIKSICEFLDTEFDPNIFDMKNDGYHLLGNDMRHGFDGTIIENPSWRKIYSDESYNTITKILKPYLKRFDYI